MGFNFPSAPTIGQLHPTPAVVGLPQYQWNGSEWVTPAYNPLNYVLKSGDTMLGALNVVTPPTAPAHAASKSYVDTYAAPLDALSYSGMQINGSMEVNQDRGHGNAISTSAYICDGWYLYRNGTMGLLSTSQLVGTVPGLPYLTYIATTVAQPSLGANDAVAMLQRIEGFRVIRLGWGGASPKPITIGFWTAHQRTGTYSVAVKNGAGDRSYATTYTQNAAGVAEYKVVTIPGDGTGNWPPDNTSTIVVVFAMACGSVGTAPSANTWLVGDYNAAPGQVNGVATTSDAFRITGIVVLPGIYAPTAAQSPLIMRPYDQELLTCQRYYEKALTTAVGTQTTAGINSAVTWSFKVRKRAVPTFTNAGTGNGAVYAPHCEDYVTLLFVGGFAILGAGATADARL